MSNVNGNHNLIQWWRWPLVPVAAIAGGVVGAFLLRVIGRFSLNFGGFTEGGWMQTYILPLFVAGTFGWLFVWISHHVAPKQKQTTSKIVAWLLVVFNALNIIFAWLLSSESVTTAMLGSIAASFGALMALAETRTKTSSV